MCERIVCAGVVYDNDAIGRSPLGSERFETFCQQAAAVPVDDEYRNRHVKLGLWWDLLMASRESAYHAHGFRAFSRVLEQTGVCNVLTKVQDSQA